MKNVTILLFTAFALLVVYSCKSQGSAQNEQIPLVNVKTVPVQIGEIKNNVSFNGKTIYLIKNLIVSPIAGYVVKMNVKFGDQVKKDDILFEIQTKENKALEDNNNKYNGTFGIIKVSASSSGTISELNISQTGGYVLEGGALCSIVENRDLMVQINVPFEYNSKIKTGTRCKILLTDNTFFDGAIYRILPTINESSQTQNVLIKPDTNRQLPENLNLTVQFVNTRHLNTCLVPIDALMTNETQSEFWVMKIISGNLAVKVPIKKGIENENLVEVLSPNLNKGDFIIREGAYGLEDSTLVNIVK
ncbi:MAG: HlyD family efflux transporter periplasmic adaptor subunit [Bacteroidales bacterium]|nr:HlyD family efflux transporter periplasmic adaptor subunit [Bacteroidales bacterium]